MGRAFGILLIVSGVWLGAELLARGPAGAFGGLLADLGLVAPAPASREGRLPERARARFEEAYRTGVERVERQVLE